MLHIAMNFRRYYVPDSIVFITQVVNGRAPAFSDERHVQLLRSTLRAVQKLHPFTMLAYVFLPDHIHLLLQPTGQSTFSQIMHSLKPNFTKAYKNALGITGPVRFWQQRFWDHVIRDVNDLQRHLDYIHYNPVKHGLAKRPEDWPHSSFREWKRRGAYADGWGWNQAPDLGTMDFE
jgi:putative transposase